MKKPLILLTTATLILVSACATPTSKQTGGAVIGGLAGGVLGSQVGKGKGRDAAMVVGTLLGAALGGAIGRTMDETDVWQTQRTLENTQTGQRVSWTNPDTQVNYEVTPTKTYDTPTGPCREYETVAIIDGKREVLYGEACRQPDGTWKSSR